MLNKGSLFIISAPSGAGKTSLISALVQEMPSISVSVSYTTRPKRAQETEGADYHFVSINEFHTMLTQGVFLEHAEVFGNWYGTSRVWVEEARNKGLDVILEIDWQGAKQVRAHCVETHSIFVLPLSREILRERLQKRHPGETDIIQERMEEAKDQILHYPEYDYLIFNDRFEEALTDLKSIIRAQRLYGRRQALLQAGILAHLIS